MQPDRFEVAPFPSLTTFEAQGASERKLRVCIATEEIAGPVANGGIATTYFDLARFLAERGHEVTVLYLKGRVCQNETIEHWVARFAELGVTLVPLPDAEEDIETVAPEWQNRAYRAWLWLRDRRPAFDVIHTSEWRGGAYYALLAKRQGLAFADTLFVVKTSSPHLWNRHYQMRFLEKQALLGVLYPEQMTVELADMVVGGSAHLLRFMEHIGYRLPASRTFVQPNLILLDRLKLTDGRPPLAPGDEVELSEIVFFGRLEQRKGLEIFCDALDMLVARDLRPTKVTFLGKEGGTRIPSHPQLRPKEFIQFRARYWPWEVVIEDGFDQPAAIGYLLEKPRLAVMPSLIENSTMAVYEALIYRIPFVASHAGGTPELVDPAYHEQVLCRPEPEPLARALERVLTRGQVIAAPAFSNEENLATWERFHDFLAWSIPGRGVARTLETIAGPGGLPERGRRPERLSLCIAHLGDAEPLLQLLESLAAAEEAEGSEEGPGPEIELCVALPPGARERRPDLAPAIERIEAAGGQVVEAGQRTLGRMFNALAEQASGEVLVFLRSDIHRALPGMARRLAAAFAQTPAAALAPAFRRQDATAQRLVVPMGGDDALGFFDRRALCGEVLAVRSEAFRAVGGFSELHGLGGLAQNLAMRLVTAERAVEALPQPLYEEEPALSRWQLDEESAQYLTSMALINEAPLPLRRILLAARLQPAAAAGGAGAGVAFRSLQTGDTVWQNWSTPNPDNERLRLRVGLDTRKPVLGVFARLADLGESLPSVVIEWKGRPIMTSRMSPFGEGFLAKWVPETAPQFGGSTVQLLIRVRCDGEPDDRLQRRLQIAPGSPGVVGVTSPRHQIEDWPEGEPATGRGLPTPRLPLRSGTIWKNWSIPHPDDRRARLQIGLDAEAQLFGFFIRLAAPPDQAPELSIEAQGRLLFRVVSRPLGQGFHAAWAPKATEGLLGKSLLVRVDREDRKRPVAQQRLSIIAGPPGIVGVISRRNIADWPEGLPPAALTGG